MTSIDIIDSEVTKKIDDSFNKEYILSLKDLKGIFPRLISEEDFSLIPLFNRLTREFIVDLKQNPSNYSISSFRYAGKDGSIPGCHYFENGRIYDLKVEGRRVSMNIHKIDVNPVSSLDLSFSRRHYWMSDRVTLKGNEHQVKVLSGLFHSFIQRQNLEKLIAETKQEILEIEAYRTNTGFERPKEFHDLYFEESETKGDDIL